MQSYDETIRSASEIIVNAMTDNLGNLIEQGMDLDDHITDILRPIGHNVEETILQAGHDLLLDRYQGVRHRASRCHDQLLHRIFRYPSLHNPQCPELPF